MSRTFALSMCFLFFATSCQSSQQEQTGTKPSIAPVSSSPPRVVTAKERARMRDAVEKFDVWRATLDRDLKDPESELAKNGPCDQHDLCHAEIAAPAPLSAVQFRVEWFYDNPSQRREILVNGPRDPSLNCDDLKAKEQRRALSDTVTFYECRPDVGGESIIISTTKTKTLLTRTRDAFAERKNKSQSEK